MMSWLSLLSLLSSSLSSSLLIERGVSRSQNLVKARPAGTDDDDDEVVDAYWDM